MDEESAGMALCWLGEERADLHSPGGGWGVYARAAWSQIQLRVVVCVVVVCVLWSSIGSVRVAFVVVQSIIPDSLEVSVYEEVFVTQPPR